MAEFQKELDAAVTTEQKREVMKKGFLMGKDYATEINETAKIRGYHPMVYAAGVYSLFMACKTAMPEIMAAVETIHLLTILDRKPKTEGENNESGQG